MPEETRKKGSPSVGEYVKEWTSDDEQAYREGRAMQFLLELNNMLPSIQRSGYIDLDPQEPTSEQKKLLNHVHPMKMGLPFAEACHVLGFSPAEGNRIMKDFRKRCPNLYAEYVRWPAPALVDLIKAIHPDFGRCRTIIEIMDYLSLSEDSVRSRLTRLKTKHPDIIQRIIKAWGRRDLNGKVRSTYVDPTWLAEHAANDGTCEGLNELRDRV